MNEQINGIEINEIVQRLMAHETKPDLKSIDKFDVNFIISLLQKEVIDKLETQFKKFPSKGVDLVDFVRIFLSVLIYNEHESLYYVIATIDFFRQIQEKNNMKTYITQKDLTNFVTEFYSLKFLRKNIIETKNIPQNRIFDQTNREIRDIDIHAPVIQGAEELSIRRLIFNKILTDSIHHDSKNIKQGKFMIEQKLILVLDDTSDKISVYNTKCNIKRYIKPKRQKDATDIIILNFDWSQKQQRIGACLKDFTLIFWDCIDEFKFEKNFSTSMVVQDLQTKIFYIEYLDLWLTTDQSNNVVGWDLVSESNQNGIKFKTKAIKGQIQDIVEIRLIKKIAISSTGKQVTVWDYYQNQLIMNIDFTDGGLHSLVYFNSYQVLITCGYESSISVNSLDPQFLDHSLVGKLIGHTSMVVCVQVIEKTPMIISQDDLGIIKVWDIRNLLCIQTIDYGSKILLNKIINLDGCAKICFLGSRVQILDWDEALINVNQPSKELFPIKSEYNKYADEIIVFTRKDIRIIDVKSGRVKCIQTGILSNVEDDIIIANQVEQNTKFLIGNQSGKLQIYNKSDMLLVKELRSHKQETSLLKIDQINQLYLSIGNDYDLNIQQEQSDSSYVILRQLRNCHKGQQTTILELSVYHNMIATASNSNCIYLWDYEYLKLLFTIKLPEKVEPTALQFINGYQQIVVGNKKLNDQLLINNQII